MVQNVSCHNILKWNKQIIIWMWIWNYCADCTHTTEFRGIRQSELLSRESEWVLYNLECKMTVCKWVNFINRRWNYGICTALDMAWAGWRQFNVLALDSEYALNSIDCDCISALYVPSLLFIGVFIAYFNQYLSSKINLICTSSNDASFWDQILNIPL